MSPLSQELGAVRLRTRLALASAIAVIAFVHMQSSLEQFLVKLEAFEGSIPWMYRDTVGKVTVGVGVMLPDIARAVALAFRIGGQPASEAQIAADFQRVQALPMGRAAPFYHIEASPQLEKAEIDALLQQLVLRLEGELRAKIAGFDAFPEGPRMALLDMAYNLGLEGLLNGYPKLIQAAQTGNWKQAAAQSFRHGPGAERNQWTQAMFLGKGVAGQVIEQIEGQAEGVLLRFAFGMLGLCASLVSRMRRKPPST